MVCAIRVIEQFLRSFFIGGNIWSSSALTTLIDLSAGIGSAIVFPQKTHTKFLLVSPSFSIEIIIYVPMTGIFLKVQVSLLPGACATSRIVVLFREHYFNCYLIPKRDNPVNLSIKHTKDDSTPKNDRLMRAGVSTAPTITIHNFPGI